eukprot:365796-Hanusia_phi.AAC.2
MQGSSFRLVPAQGGRHPTPPYKRNAVPGAKGYEWKRKTMHCAPSPGCSKGVSDTAKLGSGGMPEKFTFCHRKPPVGFCKQYKS